MEEKQHITDSYFRWQFRQWYEKYERSVSALAFVGGFILDNVTLSRIDRFFDMFVMFFWLIAAAVSILAFHFFRKKSEYVSDLLRFFIQIAFGALFSGFTVMYMRSGSFVASFPFLALVIFLFVGNEFFRKHYLRLTFQVSILFTAVFFLMIFYVPILLGRMGAGVFLLSGGASLALIAAFALLLFALLPRETRMNKTA
ncbi:MAG: hypothetical protein HYT94_03120 [Parcubacteria group bacterium]|nr:hypothetical protein [Parcubacteria group bacterium]